MREHRHRRGGGAADGLDEQFLPLQRDAAAHVDEVLDGDVHRAGDLEFERVVEQASSPSEALKPSVVLLASPSQSMRWVPTRRGRDVVEELQVLDLQAEGVGQPGHAEAVNVRRDADPLLAAGGRAAR